MFPEANEFSMERDFFPQLTGKNFYAFKVKEKFTDIGTPERLKQAKEAMRKGGNE